MKETWTSPIYCLLMVTVIFVTTSCSNEYRDTNDDLFYISSNIRNKVTEGIMSVSEAEKELFNSKLDALVTACNTPPLSYNSATNVYMETKEYIDFKEYIVSVAPNSYYLLIEVFLKGDTYLGAFSYMFQDIVEASYPGLISRVLDELENVSAEDFLSTYPQVCVEHLLYEMGAKK